MCIAALRRFSIPGLSLFVGSLLLLLTGGCASTPPSNGGTAYQHGTLVSQESADMDTAWDACHGALKRLEFEEESSAKDALEATLVARSATDRRISFKLRRIDDKVTELKIRVGMFGDERFAREVHEAFRKSL